MDKDRIEGKLKDVTGRVERQTGEWTGDEDMQSEGAAKQAEGKTQETWGKIKDEARNVAKDLKSRAKDKADKHLGEEKKKKIA